MKAATSNRRDFLRTTAALAGGITFMGSRKVRKPNLLFLWTDEQRADTMAVYGNPRIHAPHLNRFAQECMVFENAYVSQPVCTPSRATVMTGLWPHTTGCVENNIPVPKNLACFPELLNDREYRTGYFGKWHLGDEIFPQHGFEEWQSIEDGYNKYYGKDRPADAKSSYCRFLKQLGYKPDTGNDDFSRQFCSRLPLEHCKPKFLEMRTCEFLERHRNDPFVLYVNFLEPHMPFNGPLNHEHEPSQVTLPANFSARMDENDPQRYRSLREHYRLAGAQGQDLTTEAGWRRLIANYWGLVTQVDLSVGAILKKLEELELADNTIVVYTSDHGDMMGSHQLLAKTVMYEEAVRVPWLMRIPQLGRKQRIVGGRVSHIDVAPTLLDVMGRKKPEGLPGQSLLALMKSGKAAKDYVYIEWNHVQGEPSKKRKKSLEKPKNMPVDVSDDFVRTVISPDGWKLCLSDKDKCQLFHLKNDPGETMNLFYTSAHKEIIKDLTKRIHAWQKKVADPVSI